MNGVIFLECVAEPVIEELKQSEPYFNDLEISNLIRLCYIYTLESELIARAHNNCHWCQQDSPGHSDHMENSCLAEREEVVCQYYQESVTAFSRPLVAEVCRSPRSFSCYFLKCFICNVFIVKFKLQLFSALIEAMNRLNQGAMLILLNIYQRTKAATEEPKDKSRHRGRDHPNRNRRKYKD